MICCGALDGIWRRQAHVETMTPCRSATCGSDTVDGIYMLT